MKMIYTITITMTITITITVAITVTIMMMTMTMTMTMTMMMMTDLPYGAEGGIGGYVYLGILQSDKMKSKVTAEYIGREIKTVVWIQIEWRKSY